MLPLFELFQLALNQSLVLPGEGSYLVGDPRVKDKVDGPLAVAFNAADFLLSLQAHFIGLLDRVLAGLHRIDLSGYDACLELVTLRLLHVLLVDLLEQPLLIVHVELIGEPVAEHVILLKVLNRVHKQVFKGGASHSEALYLL